MSIRKGSHVWPQTFFPNITSFSYFLERQNPDFFPFSNSIFVKPYLPSNLCSLMSGLDKSAKTRYQPIFWHCLGAVLQCAKSGLKTAKIPTKWAIFSIFRYCKYSRELISLFEIKFFLFGNIWQFINNSNSSNTKYFYDWPISNSLNTPVSNYFLTV